jgi:hypothetical protein
MSPKKLIGAPSETRNVGSSGKIASLETSLSRLARPSSQTTRGKARSERKGSLPPDARGGRGPESGSALGSGGRFTPYPYR